MKKEYRHVLHNFELSYKEAKTLSDAEDLLQQMHDNITTLEGEYDMDLLEAIEHALNTLRICNPRLNVEITLENGEEEE